MLGVSVASHTTLGALQGLLTPHSELSRGPHTLHWELSLGAAHTTLGALQGLLRSHFTSPLTSLGNALCFLVFKSLHIAMALIFIEANLKLISEL